MFRGLNISLAASLCLLGVSVAPVQSATPEEVLRREFQLRRLPASNIWVVGLELELRELWSELPRHQEAMVLLDQALGQRVQANFREWSSAERVEKTLLIAIAALEPNNRDRARLQSQLLQLRRNLTPPEQLGDREEVRGQLIELSERRNALWITAQLIRQKTPLLMDAYKELADRPRLEATLRLLGPHHRLGPERNYEADIKRLAEVERFYLTAWVPLFRSGERLRFTAIANEATPITFTWVASSEPTFITAAMAESLGVKTLTNGEETEILLGKRVVACREGVIPSLRLGKYRLREISVFVLPPDAEFAGAQLGPSSLKEVQLKARPSHLRLEIAAARE